MKTKMNKNFSLSHNKKLKENVMSKHKYFIRTKHSVIYVGTQEKATEPLNCGKMRSFSYFDGFSLIDSPNDELNRKASMGKL